MKANTPGERLINGILKENPTFVLMLGMCPTLAVTTSAINGIGMGLTTTVILAASNLLISLLRNFIPDRVRIASFAAGAGTATNTRGVPPRAVPAIAAGTTSTPPPTTRPRAAAKATGASVPSAYSLNNRRLAAGVAC